MREQSVASACWRTEAKQHDSVDTQKQQLKKMRVRFHRRQTSHSQYHCGSGFFELGAYAFVLCVCGFGLSSGGAHMSQRDSQGHRGIRIETKKRLQICVAPLLRSETTESRQINGWAGKLLRHESNTQNLQELCIDSETESTPENHYTFQVYFLNARAHFGGPDGRWGQVNCCVLRYLDAAAALASNGGKRCGERGLCRVSAGGEYLEKMRSKTCQHSVRQNVIENGRSY
jgi:hypothetical protein